MSVLQLTQVQIVLWILHWWLLAVTPFVTRLQFLFLHIVQLHFNVKTGREDGWDKQETGYFWNPWNHVEEIWGLMERVLPSFQQAQYAVLLTNFCIGF